MKHEHENAKLTTADFAAAAERTKEHEEKTEVQTSGGRQVPIENRDESLTPLFSREEGQELRSRWGSIQTGFVDEPRHAVAQADELVAEVMRRLAESFSQQKSQLEKQWDQGDKISTEELRVTLRRYRSFFERFLSL